MNMALGRTLDHLSSMGHASEISFLVKMCSAMDWNSLWIRENHFSKKKTADTTQSHKRVRRDNIG